MSHGIYCRPPPAGWPLRLVGGAAGCQCGSSGSTIAHLGDWIKPTGKKVQRGARSFRQRPDREGHPTEKDTHLSDSGQSRTPIFRTEKDTHFPGMQHQERPLQTGAAIVHSGCPERTGSDTDVGSTSKMNLRHAHEPFQPTVRSISWRIPCPTEKRILGSRSPGPICATGLGGRRWPAENAIKRMDVW
jgi:hypothetical protein